ncbi:MAG: alpha/beta hydrolase [Saprospiraceae bacterium]|nr:alpha/beta hydrolase [Saprospiraceae bacterium]
MKNNLLLLHGALGAASQFNLLVEKLKDHFDVHAFDFSGHGANDYHGSLSMQKFSNDILDYLNENGLKKCELFGYSMGGYAAVTFALEHPERVDRIMTLGTKWKWDPETSAKEVKMLNTDKILEKVPAFADMLKQRHTGLGWKSVLNRTAELMEDLGNTSGLKKEDFVRVGVPVRICLGSEDSMVTTEESVAVAEWIPQGTFKILAGVPHPLEKVDVDLLSKELKAYF